MAESSLNKVTQIVTVTNDEVSLQGTSVKLNEKNYLLWKQAMKVFLGAKGKLKYILADPPLKTDPKYVVWEQENYVVMGWLWNSMEAHISANCMFMETAKGVWERVQSWYSNDRNISMVYELYEKIITT
ncbi:uncharacterized protein LOC143852439 [Tasmannia lanceolata]|uniref:uncharacterized protein LOC143852439 n=1 Tax=Tasmannia lanceolata TaxID=3420 RepID=UPI0040642C81